MGLDESHPHTPWAGGHARSPVRDAAPDASTPPITVVTRRTGWGCRPGPWGDLVGGCGARRPQGVGEPPAHRRYRRDDGTTATYEAPGSWMPRRGDSPAANRRCASARSHGHEEDPPRALIIARRCPMRRRCVVSADRWRVARTPAARLIPESSLANTCPSRRHWNSSLRCSAHNTMHTPCVKEWGATQRPRTSSPDSSPLTTSMMPLERVTDLHRRVPNVCRQTHRQRHDWPSRCRPNGYLQGRGFESRMEPTRGPRVGSRASAVGHRGVALAVRMT